MSDRVYWEEALPVCYTKKNGRLGKSPVEITKLLQNWSFLAIQPPQDPGNGLFFYLGSSVGSRKADTYPLTLICIPHPPLDATHNLKSDLAWVWRSCNGTRPGLFCIS